MVGCGGNAVGARICMCGCSSIYVLACSFLYLRFCHGHGPVFILESITFVLSIRAVYPCGVSAYVLLILKWSAL